VSTQIYPRSDDTTTVKVRATRIEQAEENSRRPYPKEYHDFLVEYGGGFPWPHDVVVETDVLRDFVGDEIIAIFEFYDLEAVVEYSCGEVFKDATPDSHLFIADANGLQLLMSVRDQDFGRIYAWRPTGIKWGDEGNNQTTIVVVSDNFRALMLQLTDFRKDGVGKGNWETGARRSEAQSVKFSQ
jgi:hypothetical protein